MGNTNNNAAQTGMIQFHTCWAPQHTEVVWSPGCITGGDGGGAVQKHAQFLCLVLAIVAVVCDEKFSSNSAKWQEFEQENDG